MLKETLSAFKALVLSAALVLAVVFAPATARAEVYTTERFTLSLPLGWTLTKGPIKKDGGEMAVFGRNDRKAAFIIVSGAFEPGQFRALTEKFSRQPGMTEVEITENQALLKSPGSGHDEYTLLRQDETQKNLIMIKFSGELSEMKFLSTGMTSPIKGLVPELH